MRRPAETVSAAVNASSIAVDGVIKADVGTIVVGNDLPGLGLFEDFEFGFGRFTEPLD
jgi:hypothetical protein